LYSSYKNVLIVLEKDKRSNPNNSSTDEYDLSRYCEQEATFNHPITYQTQKYYNELHFKTVQATKLIQMPRVNSPRVECQIPDIGITACQCHAENYNLKSKIRSQREREKQVQWGKKAQHDDQNFPFTEAMKLNDICSNFFKCISAFTSLKTLLF